METQKLKVIKNWIFGIMFAMGLAITWNQAHADPGPCQHQIYQVKKGDTLLGIIAETKAKTHAHAKIFGKGGALSHLVSINRNTIQNQDLIFPGQKIQLPEELTPDFNAAHGCRTPSAQEEPSEPQQNAPVSAPQAAAPTPPQMPPAGQQQPPAEAPTVTAPQQQAPAPQQPEQQANPQPAQQPPQTQQQQPPALPDMQSAQTPNPVSPASSESAAPTQ